MKTSICCLLGVVMISAQSARAPWPAAQAPVVPDADGYVKIPGAAIPIDRARTYKVIFDGTKMPQKPSMLAPAINNAASELNGFAVEGVPPANIKMIVVFHGAATDAILNDATYMKKYGVRNPNLKALAAMKKAGVELFVCGQYLAAERIDPAALAPEVAVASDALVVLMTYNARGYTILSY